MCNFSNEDIIKAAIIDFLLRRDEVGIIGSEILYGRAGKFADFINLTESITAFEVKSRNDDFRGIKSQLNSYLNVFEFVYLVTTDNHLNKIRNLKVPNLGVVLVKEYRDIQVIKEAKFNSNTNNEEILASINANYLKQKYSISKSTTANKTRELISALPKEEIMKVFIQYLKGRLQKRNNMFFAERGTVTHYEDVSLLSNDLQLRVL